MLVWLVVLQSTAPMPASSAGIRLTVTVELEKKVRTTSSARAAVAPSPTSSARGSATPQTPFLELILNSLDSFVPTTKMMPTDLKMSSIQLK